MARTRSTSSGKKARSKASTKTRSTSRSRSSAKKTSTAAKRTRSRTPENTEATETTSTVTFGRGRWVALFDLCGLLTSVYLLTALASWSPTDSGFSRVGGREVDNAAGPVGAWLADFLLQTVGYGAWTVAGLGLLFLVRLTGRRPGGFARFSGGIGLFWVILCALALLFPMQGAADFPAGGMIGLDSTETLLALVGEAGVWIGLAGVTAISLTLGLGVHWERLVGGAATGVSSRVPNVATSGAQLGRRAASGAAGVRSALDRLWSRDTEEEWTDATGAYDTGDWTDATGAYDTGAYETGEWDDVTGVVDTHTKPPTRSSVVAPAALVEEVPSSAPPPRKRTRSSARKARPEPRNSTASERLPALPISIHEPSLGPLPRPTLRPPDVGPRNTGTVSPTRVAERELVEVEWEATAAPISRSTGPVSEPDYLDADFAKPPAAPPSPVRQTMADGDWNQPVFEKNPTPRPSLPDAFHDPRANLDDLDHEPPTRPSAAPPPPAPVRELRPRRTPEPVHTPSGRVAVEPGALVSGGDDHGGILIDAADDIAFELPHLGLLDRHERSFAKFDEIALRGLADKLTAKLEDFGVKGEVTAIRPGPVITTFEYLPASGIKLSKITSLEDDIAMALCALRVRIVAPIPGKGVVGFEVPNEKRLTVWIRDILASEVFRGKERALPMALGKNVEGKPLVGDLAKAPHLLVAGTTGSGKSVGVNAMLMSMLYTRTPEELRLILIDPKMLEFELYQDIPHLLHPVVTDPALASAALKWACDEMDRRYHLLARWKTRNIASYNERVKAALANWTPETARKHAPKNWPSSEPVPPPRPLPYIVVVIDELADLMMVAAKDVEVSIARLAQKARAAGIHLIVATQRPEKTVVTGIIKANLPSRIAFQVRSKLDGRIILDTSGAEALLGKGDMLYLPPGTSELIRCQSPFVEDDEVRRVTDHLRSQGAPVYEAEIKLDNGGDGEEAEIEYDELYDLAVAYVVEQGKASTSMIQRQFKIGYNRAARIVEVMEMEGVVGAADGARPRKILVGAH